MNPELEGEILDLMEKHEVSYDEAFERYMRKQKQLELAKERHNATKIKSMLNRQKQKQVKKANESLHPDS